MCITTDTVHDICRHAITFTDPCFAARHPNIPFTICRPSSILDAPPTLCPSCLAIFAEAGIDGYSATRLVGQFRRRENYGGVLIPRLGEQGIRMMDRNGTIFGRIIPRGAWWSETAGSTELESARGRTMRRQQQQQQQQQQREEPGSSTLRASPRSPTPASRRSPGPTRRGGTKA